MRNEQEMLTLITQTAIEDPRIRAAYLEGSRVNSKVPADMFQDYDVVYIVNETKSFREDKTWIDRFGERLFMQLPEENVYYPSDVDQSYGWLIQFADGSRLDLHVSLIASVQNRMDLYRVLVDKDGYFPQTEQLSDEIYWIQKPTEEEFLCTCNEFWWCFDNAAKGLWRDEMPYVMDMLDFNIRPMLKRLLIWKIGIDYDFSISAGKAGKYMKKYLPDDIYQRFLETYARSEKTAVWTAIFKMCELGDAVAKEVSDALCFNYNETEAINCMSYLKKVQKLPADAKTFD
ncbi:aminoglycoside 6-adenylyltransferase [Dielma fastidiosa]|uniref:aminoglycoside 6-adenylyltransferase n=1 Tax=Dielma fastidiosa TaxID=1034346 RepID=UPI000EE7C76F|nr:aminoglycoside 6-adenylyltransferase [Dielma fastidiosa]HAH92745.1 aminoglycoside adenylyltransferase [Dielma fastidiosa]